MRFRDRREAGERLALRLRPLRGDRAVVLGLSEGGLVVAAEIADVLGAPLDILLTARIEAAGPPPVLLGAVGEGGLVVWDHGAIRRFDISADELTRLADQARGSLARQVAVYRRDVAPVPIAGRTVVLADDGAATGTTAHTAIRVLRARQVRRIVLAVPVAQAPVLDRLAREVDQFVCLHPLPWLHAVRNSYRKFPAVADTDALELLHREPRLPTEVPR
ncbi:MULTISPECIES: phosphoribosyltransferase [Amycolatopsis]|uniref:Predicted phosphoribosyltransferase n=1 Tax=Amycolatopsis tolypomycina TaxID=208445 RepID=A0A1H4ZC06_9PSEU|nr:MULTISPECIES: phosphoribosyltransferase family protein [Amycolatopsis]QKV75787.1 phosphoribosyltransferase [Amycolatopsis sp. Hca4]SED27643.1 Predicted phosphoribosyltransferase [Amycolatopsis tolypomycina]